MALGRTTLWRSRQAGKTLGDPAPDRPATSTAPRLQHRRPPARAASFTSVTCPDKPQERQDQEGRAARKDAQDTTEERRQEDGGPGQEVQECPGPARGLELLSWERALLVVHLLQGVLEESGDGAATGSAPRLHLGVAEGSCLRVLGGSGRGAQLAPCPEDRLATAPTWAVASSRQQLRPLQSWDTGQEA